MVFCLFFSFLLLFCQENYETITEKQFVEQIGEKNRANIKIHVMKLYGVSLDMILHKAHFVPGNRFILMEKRDSEANLTKHLTEIDWKKLKAWHKMLETEIKSKTPLQWTKSNKSSPSSMQRTGDDDSILLLHLLSKLNTSNYDWFDHITFYLFFVKINKKHFKETIIDGYSQLKNVIAKDSVNNLDKLTFDMLYDRLKTILFSITYIIARNLNKFDHRRKTVRSRPSWKLDKNAKFDDFKFIENLFIKTFKSDQYVILLTCPFFLSCINIFLC